MLVPEESLSQQHQASFLRAEWGCDSPKNPWWRISNPLLPKPRSRGCGELCRGWGAAHLPAGWVRWQPQGRGLHLGCRERPVSGRCPGSTSRACWHLPGGLSLARGRRARWDPGLGLAPCAQRGALTFLQHPHFEAFHEATGLAGLAPPFRDLTLVGGRAAVLDVAWKQTQKCCRVHPGPLPQPASHRLDGDLLTSSPLPLTTPELPTEQWLSKDEVLQGTFQDISTSLKHRDPRARGQVSQAVTALKNSHLVSKKLSTRCEVFLIKKKIFLTCTLFYLFMAALGLHCCMGFSS